MLYYVMRTIAVYTIYYIYPTLNRVVSRVHSMRVGSSEMSHLPQNWHHRRCRLRASDKTATYRDSSSRVFGFPKSCVLWWRSYEYNYMGNLSGCMSVGTVIYRYFTVYLRIQSRWVLVKTRIGRSSLASCVWVQWAASCKFRLHPHNSLNELHWSIYFEQCWHGATADRVFNVLAGCDRGHVDWAETDMTEY